MPVNFTVADYAALGVRRISIGGAMARAAWGGFIRAARALADGRFAASPTPRRTPEINGFFRDDLIIGTDSHERPGFTSASEPEPRTGQPVGPLVDTTPADRPGPVMLEGRYRPCREAQHRRMAPICGHAYSGHDHIWTYLSTYGPFERCRRVSEWLASRVPLDDPYNYAIVDKAGRAVGIVTLMEIRPADAGDRGWPHRLFAGADRTPLGTEAQYLLARYAFEALRYRRYEWKCNALNAASRRAALRYGFRLRRHFRQRVIAKGRNRDDCLFSMLDSEWPARKAAFERWLAPENFDAEGRQRESSRALNSTGVVPGASAASSPEPISTEAGGSP